MMDKSEIWLRLYGPQIHYLNRILEGHEYLGVLTTIDAKEGIARIRTTPDLFDDLLTLLEHLPFKVSYCFDREGLFLNE